MPTQIQEHVDEQYEYAETRGLVDIVNDAAALVQREGEAAFAQFRIDGSRWRQGETYVFVLDTNGIMVVHPDLDLEGHNQIGLTDISGKRIVAGLITAATTAGKPEGWYHYQWPVPGRLLPRWKSAYVRLATAPSGVRYVVGSGVYNDRMERAFVVDLVETAVRRVGHDGEAAYSLFRDPTGPFLAKDAYVFVLDVSGVELVNPAFPNLEGRALADWKDVQGKPLIREMIDVAKTSGSGWVDYMWPKPGESVSTQKSAYVRRANVNGETVIIGCGVYLADAPKVAPPARTPTANELMALVREAAAVLQRRGEQAYAEFRQKGSNWFRDDMYIFVRSIDGVVEFHAADPESEGRDDRDIKDIHGRPFGQMIGQAATSSSGEGWVHYMYPKPGDLFPTWKSSFVKRVTFPSGAEHIVGCGIYDMQMDRAFIEDVVNRAAALVASRGRAAFPELRDSNGAFVFMDTYVFVMSPDGTELVNPAQPSLEGTNLIDLKDLEGNPVARNEIAAATKHGSAWVDCFWFKPGTNTQVRQQAFVKKVETADETFFVGSGLYLE